MKACIHCGAALPDDARFCHKCAGAQGPKKKAGGPFPWRRTAALVVPILTLLCLLTAFRKPVEALPPTTEESTEPTAAETAESPTPTESRAPTVRRNPSHFTEVKTKEEDGWNYHATYTKMGIPSSKRPLPTRTVRLNRLFCGWTAPAGPTTSTMPSAAL